MIGLSPVGIIPMFYGINKSHSSYARYSRKVAEFSNEIEKISKEHRLYESANQNYKMGLDALRRCDYGDAYK